MNTHPIRIGLIGAGKNTQSKHIPGLKKIKNVEITAVANSSLESSKKVATDFDIPIAYANWEEIINNPQINAVCIGTCPSLHAETTIAALKAGKHVLVEARMAANLKESTRMLNVAKQNSHLVAQVVPAPFSLNLDSVVIDIIKKNTLGEIREVFVTHENNSLFNSQHPIHWRQQQEYSGKNILSLGILNEIILRWLDSDPEWLISDGTFFTTHRKDPYGESIKIDIPDSISVIGRFMFGARFIYHLTSAYPGKERMEICVNGEHASLKVDLMSQKIHIIKSEFDTQEIVVPNNKKRGWQVEADFVRSIRLKKPSTLTSFEEGLRYMKFVDNVWESWTHQGKLIKF